MKLVNDMAQLCTCSYIYSGIQIPKHVVIPWSVHIYKLSY
jgi:hypothetical protein